MKIENKEKLVIGQFYYVVNDNIIKKFRYEGIATKYHDKNVDTFIFVSTKNNECFIVNRLAARVIFSSYEESGRHVKAQLERKLNFLKEN